MTINSDVAHNAPKMLIADDDRPLCKCLPIAASNMGFKLDTASNGMQLLIKARQWKPDVLIVDVNMPELDGLSVCAITARAARHFRRCVVVTGYTIAETIERCDQLRRFLRPQGPAFLDTNSSRVGGNSFPIWPIRSKKWQFKRRTTECLNIRASLWSMTIPNTEKILASRLRKYGVDTLYAPDAVHDAACGQGEAKRHHVDNFMPDGDAKYLLHRLRSAPATARVPVIVMSQASARCIEGTAPEA